MNRQDELAIIENQLDRSLRNGLHQALKYVEDLPSNTNFQYLQKISAYVELLSFILSFSEFLGSTQNLILTSMKRKIIGTQQPGRQIPPPTHGGKQRFF